MFISLYLACDCEMLVRKKLHKMMKVGIIGVPGSGKTTLARSISSKCRSIESLKNIELVSEYARRYISKYGEVTNISEQYRILEKQIEWEDSVCNNKLDIMITDSPVFLGFIYCCELPKTTQKEIMFYNDIFKRMVKLNNPIPRYDIIFHLNTSLKPIDDGIRAKIQFDDAWREKANIMLLATMEIFKPKCFVEIESIDLEERTISCIKHISEMLLINTF
jgi:nicotinamide riboside kinase